MNTRMHLYIVTFLATCTLHTPFMPMQRAIQVAKEAQIPWKHCLARMAAITCTQLLLQKACKQAAYPKTKKEWQKFIESLNDDGLGHESPEDTEWRHKTKAALLITLGAFTLHNTAITYFDQRFMSVRPTWKHQVTYGAHNLSCALLLKLTNATLPSQFSTILTPLLALSSRYYGPLAIERHFLGKSSQNAPLRLTGIAQEYLASHIASKLA